MPDARIMNSLLRFPKLLNLKGVTVITTNSISDDVHLEDGADLGQGTFLRVRSSLLRQSRHWNEGQNPGKKGESIF